MPVRLFFSLVFPLLLILAVLGALYSRAERAEDVDGIRTSTYNSNS